MKIEIRNEKLQELVDGIKNFKKNYEFWKEVCEEAKRDGENSFVINGYNMTLSTYETKYKTSCEVLKTISSELYDVVMNEVEAN